MRALVAALTLAATLGGCAFNSYERTAGSLPPLRAHIMPPVGLSTGLGFQLNQPAYVALFEIVPGAGTSLLYPGPGLGAYEQLTFGSRTLGHLRRGNAQQYLPLGSFSARTGPRFFFLIASETPLRLQNFGQWGYGLRSAMGLTHFASFNAYDSMERLVELAVADPRSERWVTDYYVHWPDVIHTRPGTNLLPVQCGQRQFWVPAHRAAEASRLLCGAQTERSKEVRTTLADPDDRPDVPERRRPAPAADEGDRSAADAAARERLREALSERIRNGTTQLDAAGRRGAPDLPRADDTPARDTPRRDRSMRPGASAAPERGARPGRARPAPSARPGGSSRPEVRPSARPSTGGRARPAPSGRRGGNSGSEKGRGGEERPDTVV